MKTLMLIGLLVTLPANASYHEFDTNCQSVYVHGDWVGCKIQPGDPLVNATWFGKNMSPTLDSDGDFDGGFSQGFARYKINQFGEYVGQGAGRHGNQECISFTEPWTGKLYRIGEGEWIAVNDGGIEVRYYVSYYPPSKIEVTLIGGPGTKNLIEGGLFKKMPVDWTIDNFLRVIEPFKC